MRSLFLLAAFTGLSSVAAGQTLHALLPGTSPLRYGTFDAETGTWLDIDTLAFADGFISGTGTWDHWAGHYLFAGFSPEATSATLWSWDGLENTIVHAPNLAGDIGALHQDLSTALFYGLGSAIVDSNFVNLGGGSGYWDYTFELQVRSVDPATGAVTDVVSLPFLTGYYSGSSTFDSDVPATSSTTGTAPPPSSVSSASTSGPRRCRATKTGASGCFFRSRTAGRWRFGASPERAMSTS